MKTRVTIWEKCALDGRFPGVQTRSKTMSVGIDPWRNTGRAEFKNPPWQGEVSFLGRSRSSRRGSSAYSSVWTKHTTCVGEFKWSFRARVT